MSKTQAILYGWRNQENGKVYIGYHKTTEIHDGYTFSSQDPDLKRAWSHGLMQRHIIYRGSESVCITLENYALKSAKKGGNWSRFYNQSVGGGKGCDKGFTNLPKPAIKAADEFLKGKNPEVTKTKTYKTFDKPLVKSISEAVKTGQYVKVSCEIGYVFNLERNQVRLNMIHQDKVDQISDLMRSDPSKSRENVEPVVVCVYPDGTKKIIDGNHTTNAAKQAGWTDVDVVFINFSDFEFNHSNVNAFGIEMNHVDKIKTPNSSQDCQRAIINLYYDLLDKGIKVDLDSAKFKATVLEMGDWWTPSKLVSNLASAKRRIRTSEAEAKRNFRKWTKRELDLFSRKLEEKDPTLAVISISSGSCYNAGVGAILNKMGGLDTWNGTIVISHNDIHEYDSWKTSESKLKKALLRIHPDAKVNYTVLDCFA